MSDYLNNLLARELGRLEAVEPRRPSRFEPPAAQAALPTAADRFGDARGEDTPETGDASRTWMTEAPAVETFADAPDAPTFSKSPPPHADAHPSLDEPRTPPSIAPETRPHTRPSTSFETRPSETFSPSEKTHARHSGLDAEAADSPSPTPKLEPSQTPARPEAKGTRTPADGGQSRTSSNVTPLTEDDDASRIGRAEPSNHPPSRPALFGHEKDEAGSATTRRAAPPRETLLVPVLDAREVISRAALAPVREAAHEADARASQLAETTTPRQSKHSARADESAASASAESSRTKELRERREGSETKALEGRRERRPTAAHVEPRVTRRAESRAAERERQQADAQAEAGSGATVNVTIGRIEIRASAPAPRSRARREGSAAAPMSLEDYLRRRGGGGGGR